MSETNLLLTNVIYQLFESDLPDLEAESTWHEIDREVMLIFEDNHPIYISWCSQPVQYAVGYQQTTWFSDPTIRLDLSQSRIWKPLVGQLITLSYLDDQHQVLELSTSSANAAVYCSSQEQGQWEMDVLHISSEKPIFS